MTHIERFAPSPTGPLHLGHAFSALTAWDRAIASGGKFLLRIEDIDQTRARDVWEQLIHVDLQWLGIEWPERVLRQSERLSDYRKSLQTLWSKGLLYPCTCTRRDIEAAMSAPQEGVQAFGPDGLIYPGTCKAKWREGKMAQTALPQDVSLRLDIERALESITSKQENIDRTDVSKLRFQETGQDIKRSVEFEPHALLSEIGDVILARKDFSTSYHLSVVLDDALQGVTHVTRGEDLFEATKIHVLLQQLLELPTPIYHHHRLIRDDAGKRLAKRDNARAISKYRDEGASSEDIRRMVGL